MGQGPVCQGLGEGEDIVCRMGPGEVRGLQELLLGKAGRSGPAEAGGKAGCLGRLCGLGGVWGAEEEWEMRLEG